MKWKLVENIEDSYMLSTNVWTGAESCEGYLLSVIFKELFLVGLKLKPVLRPLYWLIYSKP